MTFKLLHKLFVLSACRYAQNVPWVFFFTMNFRHLVSRFYYRICVQVYLVWVRFQVQGAYYWHRYNPVATPTILELIISYSRLIKDY